MKNEGENLRSSAYSGLIWGVGSTGFRDALQFFTMLILVRLLSPEIYGQAALAQTIVAAVALASFRMQSQYALQARDPKVFDWGQHTSIGILLGVAAFLTTGLIATGLWIVGGEDVGTVSIVLIVLATTFLLEPFGLGYMVFLQASHRWKPYRLLMLGSALFSSIIGVGLAALGAGVFALATMPLFAVLPQVVMYILRPHPLRPTGLRLGQYSEGKRYGVLAAAGGFMGTGSAVAENSLISAWFGFSPLGLYTRANGLANMTAGRPGAVVLQTLYPVLTRAEADTERFRRFARILLSGIILVTVPACTFLAIEADAIVLLLYGPSWIKVADFLPLIAAVVAIGTLITVVSRMLVANLQQAISLKLVLFAGLSRLATMAATLPFGITAFLVGLLGQSFVTLTVQFIVAHRCRLLVIRPILVAILASVLASAFAATIPLYNVFGPSGDWLSLAAGLMIIGLGFCAAYIVAIRLAVPEIAREFVDILPGAISSPINLALRL